MKLLLITTFLLLLASLSSAQSFYPVPDYRDYGIPDSQEQTQEVDAFILEFRKAWRNQDAATVASLHTRDVEWINAFGRTFRGRDNLQVFLETVLFPGFSPAQWQEAMASYRPVSRHYLGEVVVINSQLHSSPGSAVDGDQRRVSLNFVLVRQAGQWQIAQQIISDLRPRRTPGQ
ncbi:uncharacterized protein (TIGR02246 family) [Marinimicrobium koreense]|uniref:Uncharacterized protein (TIGR02246 family) n=1 Tax=Marinimicrobium koreense TaxID=306545 RepID=A0A3N1P254_9GAMM|nr:SgcJ/EcaC family oxidoreductase [Marinimicrobium koreense]ROQ21307.1 uncharacterized protein (TIGR02246 family) [Marinimicrobium koreense]